MRRTVVVGLDAAGEGSGGRRRVGDQVVAGHGPDIAKNDLVGRQPDADGRVRVLAVLQQRDVVPRHRLGGRAET